MLASSSLARPERLLCQVLQALHAGLHQVSCKPRKGLHAKRMHVLSAARVTPCLKPCMGDPSLLCHTGACLSAAASGITHVLMHADQCCCVVALEGCGLMWCSRCSAASAATSSSYTQTACSSTLSPLASRWCAPRRDFYKPVTVSGRHSCRPWPWTVTLLGKHGCIPMPVDGCKRGALANDMRPLCLHAPAPSRIPAPGAATAAPAAQFITAVVAYGTRESASFNFVVKGSDILLIILILCLSFPHANKHNWDDFWHFGDQGVFSAAGIVFFAYSGAPAALPHPPRSRVLRCMCGGSSRGDACLLLTQGTTPHATWQRRCAARPRPARPSARPQAGRRRLLLRCPPPTPRLAQHRRHRALCIALRRERGGMAAVCSQRRSCAVRAGTRPGARPAHRHHRLADNRGRPGAARGPAWHRPASGVAAAARLTQVA